jgi:hypothetical protein
MEPTQATTDVKVEHEIFVDKKKFEVKAGSLTGAEIRHLPQPPIGEERNLYLEVPGGEDELIKDDQRVELKNGMHFFSVPKHINPGL